MIVIEFVCIAKPCFQSVMDGALDIIRAHLAALKRTAVGGFTLEDAVDMQSSDFQVEKEDSEKLVKALQPLDKNIFEALSLPYFAVDNRTAEGFIHGRSLDSLFVAGLPYADEAAEASGQACGVFRQDELLGVIIRQNGKWGYGHVFADN